MGSTPKYIEIYHMIKDDIQNNVYHVNDFLPNERDLEKKYNVSRTTVRKSIEMLKNHGIVDVKQGRGTQIRNTKTVQEYNKVTSFTETLKRNGFEVVTKNMSIEVIEADECLSEDLELEIGDKIARVNRLQHANGDPIAIMTNYMPYHMVKGIENHENEFTALYQFIEKTYGVTVESTHDRITASNATFLEAQALNIKAGEALINVRRICYSKGVPVSIDALNIVGSKYAVELSTRERLKL